MSGFPRWLRNSPSSRVKQKSTFQLWATIEPKTSPYSSLPKAPSAEVFAHAEQSVSHPCSSDREMPASGSEQGTAAFVTRSRLVPRRKVTKDHVSTMGGDA